MGGGGRKGVPTLAPIHGMLLLFLLFLLLLFLLLLLLIRPELGNSSRAGISASAGIAGRRSSAGPYLGRPRGCRRDAMRR